MRMTFSLMDSLSISARMGITLYLKNSADIEVRSLTCAAGNVLDSDESLYCYNVANIKS